jgi:deoxycytidylate deaminase
MEHKDFKGIPGLDEAMLNPIAWVAGQKKPSWDNYFMAMTFLAAMRSPDRQTKQGAVIVDWDSKTILGIGYNGHPRGLTSQLPTMRKGSALVRIRCDDGLIYEPGEPVPDIAVVTSYYSEAENYVIPLPTEVAKRERDQYIQGSPDKYVVMAHCETNALLACGGAHSNNAVLYVPMPSCNACAALMLNAPFIKIRRIVFFEDRGLENTLYANAPHVIQEKYDIDRDGHPIETFLNAATYMFLRESESDRLSAASTNTYR